MTAPNEEATHMDDQTTTTRRRTPRIAAVLGLLAAGAAAGSIFAGTVTASAETVPSTTAPTATASADAPDSADRTFHPGGEDPVRSDEKALTTAQTEQARAAALQAVPGGTVYRVESDSGDGTFEAHVTKADGTPVTVKFDTNFAVTKVENGMGEGDPAPSGNAGAHSGTAPGK